MPRTDYQEQLETLREDVLYMSELVLERLRMGLSALDQKDMALAEEVLTSDDEINQLYLDLERDCIDLLALQQPVAGDLRFVASSFKIITDLERIGDLATNLGEYATSATQDRFPDVDVRAIGMQAIELVEDAMDAYDNEDPDACAEIAVRDDEIDERCTAASQAVVRELVGTEQRSAANMEALLQDVSRLLLTIRDLERVADHGVNICARTLYMIESDESLIY
jgi:phosphate transport system protein